MDKYKITENEINENNVKSAADLLKGEPRDNKNIFDRLPELIASKVNGFIDAVISKFADYYNKGEIDSKENVLNAAINTKANAADVYKKTETYSKSETDEAISQKVLDIGAGDMAQAVYDTDRDGVVDKAKNAENAENGVQDYTQQADTLTGTGTNGRFRATATGTYTAFKIGGESYLVKAGSETEIELTSGVWYSFILDTEAKTINFKQGGAGLNFKIVGGTTQPASPKENTIWVETDTPIGEYQFSATQPTTRADGTALQNGDVWIKTGEKSNAEIQILKKNGIKIYPLVTYQYNGSTWISVTSKSYINNAWVDWFDGTLFDNGDMPYYEFEKVGGGTVTIENTIYIHAPSSITAIARTTKKIDLTPYSKLKVTVTSLSEQCGITVHENDTDAMYNGGVAHSYNGGVGIHSLDVSSVKGEYFISLYQMNSEHCTISKVWLE